MNSNRNRRGTVEDPGMGLPGMVLGVSIAVAVALPIVATGAGLAVRVFMWISGV